MYKQYYKTPSGFSDIIMRSDGDSLTELRFCDTPIEGDAKLPIFDEAVRWLDAYFGGEIPDFMPKYRLIGMSPFTEEVLSIVSTIAYGDTLSYGDIARLISDRRGKRMSAQAVGGAVGRNPICLIIPCHRVIGAGGKLIGYGGGIENKAALLKLEG